MIFKQGDDPTPNAGSWAVLAPKDIVAGDYIFQYKVPVTAFRFTSPETIAKVISAWFALRNRIGSDNQVVTIKGVLMNTDTGDIYIKARIDAVVQQTETITMNGKTVTVPATKGAGVNYVAVLAIVGGLLAALVGTLTLIAVYGGKQAIAKTGQGFGQGLGLALGLGIVAIVAAVFVLKAVK